jgi:hypothetical protein
VYQDHPKAPCRLDPVCWLSKELDWPGSLDASRSLTILYQSAPYDAERNLPLPEPVLKSAAVSAALGQAFL